MFKAKIGIFEIYVVELARVSTPHGLLAPLLRCWAGRISSQEGAAPRLPAFIHHVVFLYSSGGGFNIGRHEPILGLVNTSHLEGRDSTAGWLWLERWIPTAHVTWGELLHTQLCHLQRDIGHVRYGHPALGLWGLSDHVFNHRQWESGSRSLMSP